MPLCGCQRAENGPEVQRISGLLLFLANLSASLTGTATRSREGPLLRLGNAQVATSCNPVFFLPALPQDDPQLELPLAVAVRDPMTRVSRARIFRFAVALALLLATAPARADGVACGPEEGQRLEMARLIESWQDVRREALRLEAAPLPRIFFFDDRCLWEVRDESAFGSEADGEIPVAGFPAAFTASAHGGTIELPDGQRIPARLAVFVSTAGSPPQAYMVMPLLSIWRAEPRHAGEPGLDSLVRAVFVHEMTHTRQSDTFGSSIGRLVEAHGLGEELDDDIIQTKFESDPEFRAMWERERDLLFAAAETEPARSASLAREAIALRATRHERFFSGDREFYRELETIFLDMEGVANWAAYQFLRLEGVDRAEAVERMRRGRARWSQDEGLGLYLALDALVPGWQAEVFGDRPRSAWDLLRGN